MKDPRFPELNQKQVRVLKDYGTVESFNKRTRIFELGELQYDFFVVLNGEVTIEDPSNNHTIIVTHKKNEFTGDSGMLSHRGAQFHAFAKADTTLLRIPSSKLKEAIVKHSDVSDILLNAFLLRQETVLNTFKGGIKLLGSSNSKATYAIRDFMDKNHIWYTFLNTNNNQEAIDLLAHFNLKEEDLPILISNESKVCLNPSLDEVARYAGVLMDFEDKIFDVLIIGAGPAGLAASVYAASEGLSVVTIDANAPGGQAGKSSKIENYLGFPTGISGSDLANRAYIQAQKFGCNISIPHKAQNVTHKGTFFEVCASNGKLIQAKTVIAATGANYRKLPISAIEDYEGSGVYYSATGMNASACQDELVGIVGGGNSAGQAALFIAEHAKEVFVILRGNDLGSKMSDYLVQRIEAIKNINVLLSTEVTGLHGKGHLESVTLTHATSGATTKNITNLFTFIGAKPCTEWMGDLVAMDDKGFICTGSAVKKEQYAPCDIYDRRIPQTLETSIPGFFAVGDARKGSVKRVASAVGEGSMAVSQVHLFLSELEPTLS